MNIGIYLVVVISIYLFDADALVSAFILLKNSYTFICIFANRMGCKSWVKAYNATLFLNMS